MSLKPFRYGLVAFDLDGTLIEEGSCWVKLHKFFGTLDKADENLYAYERGAIDYGEFMRRDVALWHPRPHISTIEKVLLNFRLATDAKFVVKRLMRKGYQVAIISCSLDTLANRVGEVLGIPFVLANGLVLNEEGYLTGGVVFRVDLFDKDKSLERLAESLGLSLEECVVVGDSKFDKRFLQRAGLGVAFDPDEELLEAADVVIYELKELLRYV